MKSLGVKSREVFLSNPCRVTQGKGARHRKYAIHTSAETRAVTGKDEETSGEGKRTEHIFAQGRERHNQHRSNGLPRGQSLRETGGSCKSCGCREERQRVYVR